MIEAFHLATDLVVILVVGSSVYWKRQVETELDTLVDVLKQLGRAVQANGKVAARVGEMVQAQERFHSDHDDIRGFHARELEMLKRILDRLEA